MGAESARGWQEMTLNRTLLDPESGIPPDLNTIPGLGEIQNFTKYTPGAIYRAQVIGVPGTGKSELVHSLNHAVDSVNVTGTREAFDFATRLESCESDVPPYNLTRSTWQDVQVLQAMLAGIPVGEFSTTKQPGQRFSTKDFIGQATDASFFEWLCHQELIQDGFTSGVVVSDRSPIDYYTIWPQVLFAVSQVSAETINMLAKAMVQVENLFVGYDATFILLANPPDSLIRKGREDNPAQAVMNSHTLDLFNAAYINYYLGLLDAGHNNVVLLNTSLPRTKQLPEKLFRSIFEDVLISRRNE